MRVKRDDVLPLRMHDILSAADLKGAEVVFATATDSFTIAKKR